MARRKIPTFLEAKADLALRESNLEGIVKRCLFHRDGVVSFFIANCQTLFYVEGYIPLENGRYVRGIATTPSHWEMKSISDLEMYDVQGGRLLCKYTSEPSPKD